MTSTGRLSSSDPNLQNIPFVLRTAAGCVKFIAPEGWSVVAADYSQIELRIMAHLSVIGVWLMPSQEEDIHRATAAEVSGVEPMFVTNEQRRRAKAINSV